MKFHYLSSTGFLLLSLFSSTVHANNGIENLDFYSPHGSWPGYACTNRVSKNNVASDLSTHFHTNGTSNYVNFRDADPLFLAKSKLIVAATRCGGSCTDLQTTRRSVQAHHLDGSLAWTFYANFDDYFDTDPVTTSNEETDELLIGSFGGFVYQINGATGHHLNIGVAPGAITTAAAVNGYRAYFVAVEDPDDYGVFRGQVTHLVKLDTRNGKLTSIASICELEDGEASSAYKSINIARGLSLGPKLVEGNQIVYAACKNGVLEAYQVSPNDYPDPSAALLWRTRLTDHISLNQIMTAPLVDPQGDYVIQSWNQRRVQEENSTKTNYYDGITKLDAMTGAIIWEQMWPTGDGFGTSSDTLDPEDGSIYAISYLGKTLVKLDNQDGNVINSTILEYDHISTITMDNNGKLLVNSEYRGLIINKETLEVEQTLEGVSSLGSMVVDSEGSVWRPASYQTQFERYSSPSVMTIGEDPPASPDEDEDSDTDEDAASSRVLSSSALVMIATSFVVLLV